MPLLVIECRNSQSSGQYCRLMSFELFTINARLSPVNVAIRRHVWSVTAKVGLFATRYVVTRDARRHGYGCHTGWLRDASQWSHVIYAVAAIAAEHTTAAVSMAKKQPVILFITLRRDVVNSMAATLMPVIINILTTGHYRLQYGDGRRIRQPGITTRRNGRHDGDIVWLVGGDTRYVGWLAKTALSRIILPWRLRHYRHYVTGAMLILVCTISLASVYVGQYQSR